MRRYLELFEIVEEGVEEADFIRIDITEWTSEDVEKAIRLLLEHARSTYEHYIIQIHECRHEEEEPCSTVVIEAK